MNLKQLRVNLIIFAIVFPIFSIGMFIYLQNRTYPSIARCFDNASILQTEVSDSLDDQNNSNFLKSPQITSNNVHELVKLYSFGAFDGRVTALTVSLDDTVVASVSINGPINVFHFMTEETITISENKGIIDSLAISPSNNILASYNSSGDVALWDTNNGDQIALWRIGGASNYNRLLFVSQQELIYSTGASVYLCNLVSKENRKLFDSVDVATFENGDILDRSGVAGLAEIMLTGDRLNLIYSTDGDNDSTGVPEVGAWSFDSKIKSESFKLHDAQITDIALSSNGQRLASISSDGIINVVDLSTNDILSSISTNRGSFSNYAIALNGDGSLIFVADQTTGDLSIWNVDTLSLMDNDFQTQSVTDIGFNTTGNLVITGGNSERVDLWGIPSE